MHLEDTGCITADPKLKIAGALTKAEEGINTSCATATLANLDSCSAVDLAGLKSCLATESNTAGDDGVTDSYELAATICPIGIDSLVRGRHTVTGATTSTRARARLDGSVAQRRPARQLLHQRRRDVPELRLRLAASAPSMACRRPDAQYNSFLRCENNMATACTLPFQNDPACGGNRCTYVLGTTVAGFCG